MLNIAFGNGAKAVGIACISVGDGVVTRGAYQVSVTSNISCPDDLSNDKITEFINALNELSLTYQALSDQKVAPKSFGVQATAAVNILVDLLESKRPVAASAIDTSSVSESSESMPMTAQ